MHARANRIVRARDRHHVVLRDVRARDPVLSRMHPAFAPLYEKIWADLSREVDQRAEAA